MATLTYSQIRAHPGGTARYIANKDKIVSDRVHDVYAVLNYMGTPESTERVYAFGHHCSSNPDLVEREFELHRQRYYASKKGGVQGLKEGKNELLALHFFMSYADGDDPSYETMTTIAAEMMEHPLLKDFAAMWAHHFDKQHKHSHFLVSQFSAVGKPRKMAMTFDDYDDLRRYSNRLCVKHGLSIIDLECLRKDEEYAQWVDRVRAEGKVAVHEETKEHKRNPKQKVPTRDIYYKYMKTKEEEELAEFTALPKGKKFERNYFYKVEGKMYAVTGAAGGRVYAVPRRDKNGRYRSPLELLLLYVFYVRDTEMKYIRTQDPARAIAIELGAKTDWKLQNMMDAISAAKEMNIDGAADVPKRLADIGKQMNALNQEKRRHEASIAKHEKVMDAYRTYVSVRSRVEGVVDPDPQDAGEYRAAYAVLAQNQILDDDSYEAFRRRYEFEKQKVLDYDARMPELKRQYRNLKKIEAITHQPLYHIEGITKEARAILREREAKPETVDELIADGRERSGAGNGKGTTIQAKDEPGGRG